MYDVLEALKFPHILDLVQQQKMLLMAPLGFVLTSTVLYVWRTRRPTRYSVRSAIRGWRPRRLNSEKDFEISLTRALSRRFPRSDVVQQYRNDRSIVDIAVDGKLFIEMKKDLVRTSDHQKLIGQILQYSDDAKHLFVVLCGQTDKSFVRELKERFGRQGVSVIVK